ncbi:unnamed protein product [Adineta steineri]|uniref:Reverse transcriptase/retrotransposon-derived protein RNase H-like domain-containing protein n=1 Tax=Adineta steineri TaxID=433720 RepID=A0A815U2E1_9BILA|nr:unnamed protein product [Adineta steineri]CAF4175883.1 unnamed protein product [Adineta steineri]
MCLLKKGIHFVWDESTQWSFYTLKPALISSPVLQPPDYNRDFILFLATYDSTIGMVLVQTEYGHNEHVIYYLNKGLVSVSVKINAWIVTSI